MQNLNFEHSWKYPNKVLILTKDSDKEIQILAITVSALLHLSLFFLTYFNFSGVLSNQSIEPKPQVLDVDLLANFKTPKKQIVSESEKVNKIEPKETYKETEQNNSILDETIKRGDGGSPASQPTTQKSEKKTTLGKPTTIKPLPKVTTQKPDKSLVGNKVVPEKKQEEIIPNKDSPQNLKSQTQNNLDAALAGSLFAGQGGSPDLLPNVREGEITLLNTKASKYAVFVRRVALQVFNDLKSRAWKELNYQEIQKIYGNSIVVAKLDTHGNLTSAKLVSDSGSKTFNNLIYVAVKDKASDPHPPESALVNGEYHFIFQTKMSSSLMPNPRTGGSAERRWLVLSVGLE